MSGIELIAKREESKQQEEKIEQDGDDDLSEGNPVVNKKVKRSHSKTSDKESSTLTKPLELAAVDETRLDELPKHD